MASPIVVSLTMVVMEADGYDGRCVGGHEENGEKKRKRVKNKICERCEKMRAIKIWVCCV